MFQDHDKIKLILCLLNTTKTSIIRSSLIQLFPFYPWLKVGNFFKHFLQRKWFFHVHYLLIFQIQCQECFFQLTVARYGFSRSIPPKFERKLRRHKQGFGKTDTTVVLIKSFFLVIGSRYLHDLSHTFLKRLKLLWGEIACQKRFV